MAHFAEVIDGIVDRVLVISNDAIIDENGDEQESMGVAFCDRLYNGGTWVQTSYNNNFKKQYAGKGYSYDADKDKFIIPQPYPSWSKDLPTVSWKSPIGDAPELTAMDLVSQIVQIIFYPGLEGDCVLEVAGTASTRALSICSTQF